LDIDSVIKFLQEVDLHGTAKMYRGQSNFDWELLPSIARIDTEELDCNYQSGWQGIEEDLIESFISNAVRYLKKEPKNKLEWMIQAQHHGVPTRLLDWSSNPLKALYFAVENPHHDNTDGSIYFLSPSSWSPSPKNVDVESGLVLKAFFPVNINDRVAAQEGCFTLFPLPKSLNEFVPIQDGFSPHTDLINLVKVKILKDAKPDIREQLAKLGVNDSTMFPDLDGVSKSIRRRFGVL
jgi:hypothetical protein